MVFRRPIVGGHRLPVERRFVPGNKSFTVVGPFECQRNQKMAKNAEVDSYQGTMNRTFSCPGILLNDLKSYPVNFGVLIICTREMKKHLVAAWW